MAATLPHATMATALLTGVADFIATDGTAVAMVRTGPFATSPTEATTGSTVHLIADGASSDTAGCAE